MAHYRYLIVGGGMTADAAARGIRSVDEGGSVGLVAAEEHPPYDRPPLSKGLWTNGDEKRIWRDTDELGVDVHTGRRAVRLDREERTVTDDRGTVFSYDRLLLATGGSPRKLDDAVPQVNYFRTYDDYRRLRDAAARSTRFAVVGGGFIGSEIAAALRSNGKEVTVFFPEEGLCGQILPPDLSRFLVGYYRDRGVDVRPETLVSSVRRSGDEFLVSGKDEDGKPLRVDGVVAGLGISPNTSLAESAGLEVDDGIVVDASFQTDDPRIWAAGDAAAFYSPILDRRIRVEHEDHANSSGMLAGRGMAGEPSSYAYLPLFYSDLFDVSYEAVGVLDAEMETVEDWIEPHRKGVVHYLQDGLVRGVLLWNVPGKVKEARALIEEERRWMAPDLRGRIEVA